MEFNEQEQIQLNRLALASINLDNTDMEAYLQNKDDLNVTEEIPVGYKRCGKCHHTLKLYLFNVNNDAKNKCTGNCKACQKISAAASYNRTKSHRNYKEYYAENKEKKQEHGRKYYESHKEDILKKQKDYHSTSVGRKVMRKSHKKRRIAIGGNKGIPYKREYVIDRDSVNGVPICYICEKPVMHERELHVEHIVGIALGGKDCFSNVACAHELCNLKKTKDCREISVEQVESIIERAEKYVDDHPDLFKEVIK